MNWFLWLSLCVGVYFSIADFSGLKKEVEMYLNRNCNEPDWG